MTTETIKLGILGAAKIVPQAILDPARHIPDLDIAGLASSDPARGNDFARQYNINAFDGYQALLDDDTVRAVYIALSNDLHAEWIVAAAKAKKHILVEKPICIGHADFSEIHKAVSENNVILHEAIMVRHHPWQSKVKEIIDSKVYGAITRVSTHFTYPLSATRQNSYRFFPHRGGGSFFDNSPYWIQFIQYCFGTEPSGVDGSSEFNGPNGIDMNFKAGLRYPEGLVVDFFSSYEHPFEATHWIEFEHAKLKIRNFFRPSYGRQKLIINIEKPGAEDRIMFEPENYYFNQLKFFSDLVRGAAEPEPLQLIGERVMLTERIFNSANHIFTA